MAGHVILDSEKLRVECEPIDKGMLFRPVGVIDEDVNFANLLQIAKEMGAKASTFRFDLGQVSSINSCGVREWLLFLEKIQVGARCEFQNVAVVMVEQANIVPNLLGKKGSPVLSFQVPYYCSKCDQATTRIVTSEDARQNRTKVMKPAPCEKAGCAVEFDALEDEYFKFLTHSKSADGR